MRWGLCSTCIDEMLEADNVALDVGTGILQRLPNARLCYEVYHAVKLVLGEEHLNDLSVSHVTLRKGKSGVLEKWLQ